MKRIAALLLTLLLVVGLLPTVALAASSEEEALGEVQIYHDGTEMSYLSINGRVRTQVFTYYNYINAKGQSVRVPAYCVNPNTAGVPQTVPAGTGIKYLANQRATDPKIMGIVASGYPTRSLERLGLASEYEAYYATKMALWCYLLPNWDIADLTVNPAADQAAASRVLAAAKLIYTDGMYWDKVLTPKITAVPDQEQAYPVTFEGKEYYQQLFTVTSETWVDGGVVYISFADPDSVPEGTRIVGLSGNDITGINCVEASEGGFSGQFKILYPAESIEGQSGSVQLTFTCDSYKYAIFYATCAEVDQYGNIQNYMCDTDPLVPMEADAYSTYGGATPPEEPEEPGTPEEPAAGGLRIVKLEAGTEIPLSGAVFEVVGPDGDTIGSFATDANGEIQIPEAVPGNYTIYERVPPKDHLLSENDTQNVTVREGETATVTFENQPYGDLRVEKFSDTGEGLAGVQVQIKHIESGRTYSGTTEPGGAVQFTGLLPGAYEVREIAGIQGWIADTETVQTVTVVTGQTSTVSFTNKELPGLRIEKYDRVTQEAMAGVTFRIWRDGELLGDFTTGQLGEILLVDLDPGTYLVQEVASDDEHVVESMPQEIELKAGDGIKQLVFFNDRKPGIHLIKVDSVTMEAIPNVRFEFKLVGGSYRQELTSDENGEIDLSKLEPGAYEVRELEAPDGYLIDDAVRVVQIDPNENANFVFTNTPKPALRLIKVSSDGSPLAGVHFRIARIEDGSRYLDRVTDENGEINITDLEPGVYSVKETATVSDHILDLREYHVELFPGQTSTITIENQRRPDLVVYKRDADTGEPVPNTVFLVEAADGHSVDEIKTDAEGKAVLTNLLPGVYEISEKSVPAPYLMDAEPQLVTLYANRTHTVYFENHKKPTLTVNKVDSVTGSPIQGAKFEVWYGSNNTTTGELNSLGTFFSDENGQFILELLRDGWYKVTELEPAAGYTIKEPATQEFYISGGESKTITFENVPKNAIIVEKYDSVTGEALGGATFQLRYLAGTSGTGGTVIGQKVTGSNGMAIWTGLEPGTYVVEEVDPADGYSVIQSSETIFLADSGEQSVVTVRFENMPDGNLLIRKVCATDPSVTLPNAEFKIAYADGTLIGDSNGVYRTDENGEIRIEGLAPGKSVVVTETRAPDGFLIDTQSQTIQIREGRTVSLTFKNQPKGELIIQKRDSATGQPLPGAEFRVTTAAGCEVGLDGVIGDTTLTQNGIFTTDANGEIRVSNLAPGAYVVTEIRAPQGYVMDSPSVNVVIGQGGDTQTVVITNSKAGSLIIDKRDSLTGEPLEGVAFRVTTSTGEYVPDEDGYISSNGIYYTDRDGKIQIDGVVGTLVVTETETIPGYTIDPATQTQTVQVNPNDTQTLYFTNTPTTTLVIEKYIEGTTTPLEGVTFLVTDSSGAVVGSGNGEYITDENGRVVITDLEPGTTVTAREVKTLEGYVLDGAPKSIEIKEGEVQTLRFYNQKQGTLVIRKLDKLTGEPLAGVEFELTYAEGGYVDDANGHLSSKGLYTTDANGEIRVSGITGTIVVKETKTVPGYTIDPGTQTQTVTVNPEDTQTLTFYNTPDTTLVIEKYIEGTTTPLEGVTFLVTSGSGEPVGQSNGEFITDEAGKIEIHGLKPGETITAREIKTVEGYVLDGAPKSIEIKEGEVQTLRFYNQKQGTLVIRKLDKLTGEPLAGVEFELTYAEGGYVDDANGHLSSKGLYTTDANGEIRVSGITGTIVVKETKTVPGYTIDPGTQTQTVTVNPEDTQTLTFYNTPGTTLTIQKYIEGTNNEPLAGVTFLITDSAGTLLGPSNGEFVTDRNGQIILEDLEPGVTITAKETKTVDGFVLDGTPQSILIKEGEAQQLTFFNKRAGGVEIIKVNEADQTERIPNVTFEIRQMDGGLVDTVTTDSQGRVYVELEAGDYYAVEIQAGEGFQVDSTPHYFTAKDNETTTLTVTNKAFSGIIIHKIDSVTEEGIYGVKFVLYDSSKKPIGEYTTDDEGYIYIDDLPMSGRFYLRELEAAEGYTLDKEYKTVNVQAGKTVHIEWENTAVTGQIQIYKYAAEYNEVTGAAPGTPLEGAVYEIVHERSGKVVDYITTDVRGVAASKPLPLGRYKIVEVTAPAYWQVDATVHDVTLEFPGQIIKLSAYDKPSSLGVTLTKRGNAEVLAGNQMRYDITVANTSNVPLENFYWHDRIPTDVSRATVLTTGTYSARLNYRILYKTNYSASYQVLASNLLTSNSYSFALNAIPTQAGEVVTDVFFDFGKVPVGFQSVTGPTLTVVINGDAVNGYQLVNRADAGGKYQGTWQTAHASWVTIIKRLGDVPALPKTGY